MTSTRGGYSQCLEVPTKQSVLCEVFQTWDSENYVSRVSQTEHEYVKACQQVCGVYLHRKFGSKFNTCDHDIANV